MSQSDATPEKRTDIWNYLLKKSATNNKKEKKESSVVFVGQSNSGKSTIIHKFVRKSEIPKSTPALEYSYFRPATKTGKDLVHVYEIGGGLQLSGLSELCLTPDVVTSATVCVVCDLSRPVEGIRDVFDWIAVLRKQIKNAASENKKIQNLHKKLRIRELKRFGSNHPDINEVSPIGVPLHIIGQKYDLFASFDSDKKKAVCEALRTIAHYSGAAVVFSNAESGLNSPLTHCIAHIMWGLGLSKAASEPATSVHSPLLIPAGSDSFKDIHHLGAFPVGGTKYSKLSDHEDSVRTMLTQMEKMFPRPDQTAEPQLHLDSFPERTIDHMRTLKEEEFVQLQDNVRREARQKALGRV